MENKNNKMRNLIFIFLLFILPINAIAQTVRQGRTVDGTAFRTGQDGTVVMDQLAEHEQTIRELRNDLIDTQNELNSKTKLLERLQAQMSGQPLPINENSCAKEKVENAKLKKQIALLNAELEKVKSSFVWNSNDNKANVKNTDTIDITKIDNQIVTKDNDTTPVLITKTMFQNELNNISTLMKKRDVLYEKIEKAGKDFTLRELVTSDGEKFEDIKARINYVKQKENLAIEQEKYDEVMQNLSEIENILKEDISFLLRLAKNK